MEPAEERQRVERARVARLATRDPQERLHLVPVCFALAGDVLYTAVDRKPKRGGRLQRLANVAAHPEVALLVDHYEEDWRRLWWVRLRGRARVLEAGPEYERALDLLADKYEAYRGAGRPPGPLIAVDVAEWRSWPAAGT